jgi:hypothetical protein
VSNLPRTIGPEVAYHVLRAVALKEHTDAVLDLQDRARRAWEGVLGRETRLNAMDGMSPRLAHVAAQGNLALRRKELDAEVEAEVARLEGVHRARLARLLEGLEDGSTQ